MSAERTALRMMLVVSALAGAVWFVGRALRLVLAASGAMPAGRGQLILLCGAAALALCAFAVLILLSLRRSLLPSLAS